MLVEQEVWVAEVEGRVVGYAALSERKLEHLYVHPGFQGRGAGTALLERAKRERPEGFRFWVFQKNERARRFYERHGCRLVELTDGAGNEEREPDALYEWVPKGEASLAPTHAVQMQPAPRGAAGPGSSGR